MAVDVKKMLHETRRELDSAKKYVEAVIEKIDAGEQPSKFEWGILNDHINRSESFNVGITDESRKHLPHELK